MNRIILFLFAITFVVFLNSCSTDPPSQPPTLIDDGGNDNPNGLFSENDYQLILYGNITESQETEIRTALENNCARIIEHLGIDSMPAVTFEIWAQNNSRDFYSVLESRLGPGFEWATGYTPSFTEICMLYQTTTPEDAVHEYAHLVSLQLNPTISNNPRWLWESIAQYEARIFDHPSTWAPGDFNLPSLTVLNQYNSDLPYRWGYFISKVIVLNWGDAKYIELIDANGDVQTVLGVTQTELCGMVEQYVRNAAG